MLSFMQNAQSHAQKEIFSLILKDHDFFSYFYSCIASTCLLYLASLLHDYLNFIRLRSTLMTESDYHAIKKQYFYSLQINHARQYGPTQR